MGTTEEARAPYDGARAAMAASPRTATFKDGTALQMTPLTDKDLGELDHWVQERFLRTAKIGLSQAELDRMWPKLVASAMMLSFYSSEGVALLATIEGISHLLWVSCRKSHPTLKPEDVRHLIVGTNGEPDEENVREFNRKFGMINRQPRPDHPATGAGTESQPST